MTPPTTTDVLIVGAGPVGLLTAVGLTQQGIDCLLLEKRERDIQASFGRATTLYPRSLELLEQLHLTNDLVQEGFVARSSINYKDRKRVNERGWNIMFDHFKTSYHDYALNIRQRYSEDVFRNRYESYGKSVRFGWKLATYKIDTSLGDDYNITATLQHESMGEVQVRSKYLLGSDGGSSTVRQLAGISLDMDSTTNEWVRIDGKLSTDMPGADIGFASVETLNHGNILWVKLERDAHRIGFALTPSLLAKYPKGITKEEVVKEAIEGMKPFKLEIERLDWWTHYKECSAVISGVIPTKYEGFGSNPDEILLKIWGDNMGFNIGLGISYAKSVLNQDPLNGTLACGVRSPDALICAPGPKVQSRLYDALLRDGSTGRWSIVVFAGNPALTSTKFPALREKLPKVAGRHYGMIRLVTLMIGAAGSGWVALDGPALGKLYFDPNGTAHSEYGVDGTSGAIVVIRPDGILGFATCLDEVDAVGEYFLQFVN